MIKLVSLNIERSKHLDRVVPFLEAQQADVVCLQELMEYDIETIERVAGKCFYTGTARYPEETQTKAGVLGQGIFSRLENIQSAAVFYHGSGLPDRLLDFTDARSKHESESHALTYLDFKKEALLFRVATTHFTWTADGNPDEFQRADLRALLDVLSGLGEFTLCGDFNAPRGGEIFSELASRYADTIPAQYTTSIDKELHRAGDLQLMVDGLFTTAGYRASHVHLHSGVSDHLAIVATLESTQTK
ncbi:MAG: endonuclease/exonuclease/phosphatase family protein [Candidatus Pacebacteria bacterium]|nr:endonuclease/exonuclease/phosphatase family protein [Candidatus Paceibacterota bacterium]